MNTYAINQGVALTFYFRDVRGQLVDPSAATFKVQKPDGSDLTFILADATRTGLGTFEVEVIPDAPGVWRYRGVGTGDLLCSTLDQAFRVEGTRMPLP